MIPIRYRVPYCHNEKMIPVFTYRDKTKGIYRQFRCRTCGHAESLQVAVPDKKEEI